MKYIVNEDERIVIAVMENTALDVVDFIRANQGKLHIMPGVEFMDNDTISFDNAAMRKYLMKNEYVGRAKCHEEDIFDVEVGMRIAKTRARLKHDTDFKRIITNIVSETERVLEMMTWKSECKITSAEKWHNKALADIKK